CGLLFLFYPLPRPPTSTLFPYTTLFRSQLRPGLHVQVVAAHGVQRQECARQFVNLTDRDFWTITIHQEDEADVDSPDRRGLVVDRPQQPSELQSLAYLVCRLLLEKKKN